MKKILFLIATIYLIIAPITYHPDTKLVLYYPTLGKGKVWNIYKYLHENVDNAPKFHYPPMHFWVLKAELPIVQFIGGKDVDKWLASGSNEAFLDKNIFLYNLATKLPLLLMIYATGYFIYKILIKHGYGERKSKLAMILWLLNPITIYSGVMMGQNDILAILPFIVGLYFYFDYSWLAFGLFGIGGSIKSYPLIWAIALGFIYPTKNWLKKIGLMAVSMFVYLATILPFLKYDYFRFDVLQSGLSKRMFESAIEIGFGDKVLIVPILIVALVLIAIKNKMGKNVKGVTTIILTINFIILGFSHFHPQWSIWLAPFLSILLASNKKWWLGVLTLIPFGLVTLMFEDKFLYWGIVSPVNSNLINLPFISEILKSKGFDTIMLNNLGHSLIAGMAIYWLFICEKYKK